LEELAQSLSHLQTDYIDLLFIEGNNAEVGKVLSALQFKGQVFGVVNWSSSAAVANQTPNNIIVQKQSQKICQLSYSILERQELEENYRSIVSQGSSRIFASNPLACNMLKENT